MAQATAGNIFSSILAPWRDRGIEFLRGAESVSIPVHRAMIALVGVSACAAMAALAVPAIFPPVMAVVAGAVAATTVAVAARAVSHRALSLITGSRLKKSVTVSPFKSRPFARKLGRAAPAVLGLAVGAAVAYQIATKPNPPTPLNVRAPVAAFNSVARVANLNVIPHGRTVSWMRPCGLSHY